MTRRKAVEHINATTGIPLKKSSFDKLAAKGQAPKPAGFFGRVELYKPNEVEDWARKRLLSSKPINLGMNKSEDE
jgi:hypothetical protein